MADFDIAFDLTNNAEGGYSNHRFDLGGKTKYGFTEKFARKKGYKGDIIDLPFEIVKDWARDEFWDRFKLGLIDSQILANEIYDSAFNIGPRVAKWLQQNLNALNKNESLWNDLKEDGKIGMITLGIVNVVTKLPNMESRLLKLMNSDQTQHYKSLARRKKNQEYFMHGWLDNRVKMPN